MRELSLTRNLTAAVVTSLLVLGLGAPVAQAARPVGLGIAAGVALPNGPGALEIDPAFAWGFYTDIPLVSTFHITPSTTVYRLDPAGQPGDSATDVSLNFKFVVPLGIIEPFAGITAGVTSAQKLEPHVGGLLGLSINLISNLDVFASLNYRLLIRDGGNVGTWYIFAGPLFRFGP